MICVYCIVGRTQYSFHELRYLRLYKYKVCATNPFYLWHETWIRVDRIPGTMDVGLFYIAQLFTKHIYIEIDLYFTKICI